MKILFYLGALAIAVLILLVIFTRKKDADPFREIKIAHIESEKRLVPIFQRLLIQEFPEFQSDFTEARCSISERFAEYAKDDPASFAKSYEAAYYTALKMN